MMKAKLFHCPECAVELAPQQILDHARQIHVGSSPGWRCGSCVFQCESLDGLVVHAFATGHPVASLAWATPTPLRTFLTQLQAAQADEQGGGGFGDSSGADELADAPQTPSGVMAGLQLSAAQDEESTRFGKIKGRAKASISRWTPVHHRNIGRRRAYSPQRAQAAAAAETEEETAGDGLNFITPMDNGSQVAELEFPEAPEPTFAQPPPFKRNTGELHEKCARCGRTVKLRNERGVICRGMAISHLKACLDIRPWACAHCLKPFADKFPVSKHAAKHHGDNSEGSLKMILDNKAEVEDQLRREMNRIFPSVPMDGWKGIE